MSLLKILNICYSFGNLVSPNLDFQYRAANFLCLNIIIMYFLHLIAYSSIWLGFFSSTNHHWTNICPQFLCFLFNEIIAILISIPNFHIILKTFHFWTKCCWIHYPFTPFSRLNKCYNYDCHQIIPNKFSIPLFSC